MASDAAFWDKIADRYAADPIKDMDGYERTLARVRAHLSDHHDVLEVGCGTGSTALLLSGSCRSYRATDISSAMIEIAKAKHSESGPGNLTFERASLAESLSAGPYDVILGFNLLHLLEDPKSAVEAMVDALRPGGLLITKTACLGNAGWYLRPMVKAMQVLRKAPHVAFLSVDDLDKTMTNSGLRTVESETQAGTAPRRFVVARRG